jgi:hypothetical protein
MKSHCLRGHERTEENTALSRGKKYCLPCRREYLSTYVRPARMSAVRAWALTQGIEVGRRGPLPESVVSAYELTLQAAA